MAATPKPEVGTERERRAWQLRLRGWTQEQIAQELDVTQATISNTLKRIEKKLADQFAAEAHEIKGRQTEQLHLVFREALEQWERSKLDAELERIITKEVSLVNEDDEGAVPIPGVEVRTTNERKGQTGDPALLEKAMAALAAVRRIWGLEAAEKSEQTVTMEAKWYQVGTPVEDV